MYSLIEHPPRGTGTLVFEGTSSQSTHVTLRVVRCYNDQVPAAPDQREDVLVVQVGGRKQRMQFNPLDECLPKLHVQQNEQIWVWATVPNKWIVFLETLGPIS